MKRRTVRRLAWVGGALSLVVLAFGTTVRLLGPEPPGVTVSNLRRIRPGVTLAEVECLLGGPASIPGFHNGSTWLWRGDGLLAKVDLSADGRVVEVKWEFTSRQPSRLDPLRALLGW